MRFQDRKINGLKVRGISQAGTGTSLFFEELGLCFDVAQGHLWHLHASFFLITHGHMDHAGGIPYVISQRSLNDLKAGRFVMPKSLVEPLTSVMGIWEKIEGFNYQYDFLPIEAGQTIVIDSQYTATAFKTIHRVPSVGYTISRRKKKLLEEFADLSREEIIKLKAEGKDLHRFVDEPVVSFTGDTQIEFWDLAAANPGTLAPVIFMEVTYWDERKSVEKAREWGHIHLDELIPRLDKLPFEKLVLIHTSRRYKPDEILELLDQKVPKAYRAKIEIFG